MLLTYTLKSLVSKLKNLAVHAGVSNFHINFRTELGYLKNMGEIMGADK